MEVQINGIEILQRSSNSCPIKLVLTTKRLVHVVTYLVGQNPLKYREIKDRKLGFVKVEVVSLRIAEMFS